MENSLIFKNNVINEFADRICQILSCFNNDFAFTVLLECKKRINVRQEEPKIVVAENSRHYKVKRVYTGSPRWMALQAEARKLNTEGLNNYEIASRLNISVTRVPAMLMQHLQEAKP